jgi:nucleoside 2-deoxyribosyltransferase
MNVYFAGSIRGGRQDVNVYGRLINFIKRHGHTILNEHIGNMKLSALGETGPTVAEIYERNLKWMEACDCVIAEVTAPSLGVGYELARLEALGKPVLCLYRPSSTTSLSAMIAGSPNLQTQEYQTAHEAEKLIIAFLETRAHSA